MNNDVCRPLISGRRSAQETEAHLENNKCTLHTKTVLLVSISKETEFLILGFVFTAKTALMLPEY